MNADEVNRLYMCNFEPDSRLLDLDKKLSEYYTATDRLDNKAAYHYWLSFKLWAMNSGYSLAEINSAKSRAAP